MQPTPKATMLPTLLTLLLPITLTTAQAMGGPGGPSYYKQGTLLSIAQINVFPEFSFLSANWTSQPSSSDVFINQDASCVNPLPFLTTEPTNQTTERTPIVFAAERWSIHDSTSPISVLFDGNGVSADWYVEQFIVYSEASAYGFMGAYLLFLLMGPTVMAKVCGSLQPHNPATAPLPQAIQRTS